MRGNIIYSASNSTFSSSDVPYRDVVEEEEEEEEDPAYGRPEKGRQRGWVRYERAYSNSMWHASYKLLEDGRWFIPYMDDASRFITGFGMSDAATGGHALDVLRTAIRDHGRPASVMTARRAPFYAGDSGSEGGGTEFEKELVRLGIRHLLSRVNRPQTGGKLARFHGELQRTLPSFVDASHHRTVRGSPGGGHIGDIFHSSGPTDPVARLIKWYNHDRRHMSLSRRETPARAFVRMMPPPPGEEEDDRAATD